MNRMTGYHRRIGTAILIFLAITVGGGWGPQSALALSSGCRSDPIVILSNGATIDMSVALGTSVSNVDHVVYTLHVPPGLRVLAVVNTGLLDGTRSRVDTVNDAAPDHYWTETTAYTRVADVEVSASSALVLVTHVRIAAGSASGKEQQALRVDLQR
jgi:hypothetical protein